MPQPRISIQPVPEQIAQPLPRQNGQVMSTSADGSVKGKKLGRRRISGVGREEPPHERQRASP